MHQDAPAVRIGVETPLQEDVVRMIKALDSYLGSLYPSGSNHLLDIDSLVGEDVKFLVAREVPAGAADGSPPTGWRSRRALRRPPPCGHELGAHLGQPEAFFDAEWDMEDANPNSKRMYVRRWAASLRRGAGRGLGCLIGAGQFSRNWKRWPVVPASAENYRTPAINTSLQPGYEFGNRRTSAGSAGGAWRFTRGRGTPNAALLATIVRTRCRSLWRRVFDEPGG